MHTHVNCCNGKELHLLQLFVNENEKILVLVSLFCFGVVSQLSLLDKSLGGSADKVFVHRDIDFV